MAGIKRGRARKSIEQLKIEGKYRADRHGPETQDYGPTNPPVRPRSLTGEAKKLWDSITPRLVEVGIATDLDTQTLASMCEWWAEYRAAVEERQEELKGLRDLAKAILQLSREIAEHGATDATLLVLDRSVESIGLAIADGGSRAKRRIERMKAAYQMFSTIAARFGMTPTDRRAMRDVQSSVEKDDPITLFLKQRQDLVG